MNKKYTVGYITRNYPPFVEGGAELSLFHLANSLAERGVNVRVYVPSTEIEKSLTEGENPRVYRFHWVSKRPFALNNPLAQQKFREGILKSKEKLDIIDAYNFITALPIVSEDLNIPFVVSLRDATSLCDVRCELNPKYHPLIDYFRLRFGYLGPKPLELIYGAFGYYLTQKRLNVIRKANCVTFASQALADLFKDFNPNREVINSVAPVIRSSQKKYNVRGVDFAKDKVFLYAGRLSQGKGSKFLFDVAESIVSSRKDIKFIFAGKGEYYEIFKKTKFPQSIILTGKIPNEEMLSLLGQVRATVVPSIIFEPFPRIALESLASHTPVIGTNSGGISEAVGEAGLITEINKDALKNAIIRLSDDDDLYKKLRAKSSAQVSKFSKKTITDKVISIYEKVLSS